MNAYDIILRPVITEQSMESVADKKYVFQVAINATKTEVKAAVGCDCKTLVVTAEACENVVKSGRNIPGCQVTFASLLNVYDVLNAKKLVVDQAALAKIEEVFA